MNQLHSATSEHGKLTAVYHDADGNAGRKTFALGDTGKAMLTACTAAVTATGQRAVGFQIYTVESDFLNDGNTVDVALKDGTSKRIEAPSTELAAARDALRDAAQAAINAVEA